MATPYPNAHQIEEMYCNRASPATFKGYLDENIEGHIVGREFQIGGYFKSVDGFYEAVHAAIVPALKEETMRQEVRRVIGGADSPWAAVECIAFADSKYDKSFVIEYVDLIRFNSRGKIAYIKEFFDNHHLQAHLTEHEEKKEN